VNETIINTKPKKFLIGQRYNFLSKENFHFAMAITIGLYIVVLGNDKKYWPISLSILNDKRYWLIKQKKEP
jgi:hypothetical protein